MHKSRVCLLVRGILDASSREMKLIEAARDWLKYVYDGRDANLLVQSPKKSLACTPLGTSVGEKAYHPYNFYSHAYPIGFSIFLFCACA